MSSIAMHIHSFSLRYQFRYRDDFDVFRFIDFADSEGFAGVNLSANGPGYRDLGGTTPEHFDAVYRALSERGMGCELDTSDTRYENMKSMIDVARACGADQLRTYTRYPLDAPDLIGRTIEDLKAISQHAENAGVRVLLENHEDFNGQQIARILEAVDHPWIGALYDYGNSQMVGEDPHVALDAMLRYVSSVHMKDHVMIHLNGKPVVQGVSMGQGRLPVMELTQRLYESGLRRFCFENVWSYNAPLLASGIGLPDTLCFEFDDQSPHLNGDNLSIEVALGEEMSAFRLGWDWLREALERAGIGILKEQ